MIRTSSFSLLAAVSALAAAGCDDRPVVWLPDSSGFVYVNRIDDHYQLLRYALAKGENRLMVDNYDANFCSGYPGISPDGKKIALVNRAIAFDQQVLKKLGLDEQADMKAVEKALVDLIKNKDVDDVTKAQEQLEKLGIKSSLNDLDFKIHFGVSVRTIQEWEQGRAVPSGPARALLIVIDCEPRAVRRALASSPIGGAARA